MSASYKSNLNDLFRALGWRKLCHQRLQKEAIMMYKALYGLTQEYLTSKFVFHDSLNAYRFRDTENKLAPPRTTTH